MFFKNLAAYRITESIKLSADEITDKLLNHQFKDIGAHDEFSFGFVPPSPDKSQILHDTGTAILICVQREEKVLPPSAINKATRDRIAKIEEDENRSLPKKEKRRIRDEVLFEMIPQAFTQIIKTYAYIDHSAGFVVVDAATARKAEDIITLLRKALGSLRVTPVVSQLADSTPLRMQFTNWVQSKIPPESFEIDNEADFEQTDESKAKIKIRNEDLFTPNVIAHIENGYMAKKLALVWSDKIAFTVDADLQIKRLKFLELYQELLDTEVADEQQAFEADFLIMADQIGRLMNGLFVVLGGLKELD